ncbi:MAG: hypothetical protein ACHQAY_01005 [Hyphomicrobiales bacterium]
MATNRLSSFGLVLAALGWVLLLFGGQLSQLAATSFGRPVPLEIDPGRTDVAQSLILTGMGLAVLGALQAGVGTLRQFFEAVLQRAAAAKAQPAPVQPSAAPVDPNAVVERGWIRDRPYARFADGSVEVETLLGVRRFSSFTDAEDFVGS